MNFVMILQNGFLMLQQKVTVENVDNINRYAYKQMKNIPWSIKLSVNFHCHY